MQELNQKILDELEKDSRQTNIQISKKLRVSEGTVRQRIQKLMRFGIIKKFTIERSTKTGFAAFILLKSVPEIHTKRIIDHIIRIKGIKSVYETAGNTDVLIEVSTYSAEQFNNIVEEVRRIKGVMSTESLVVLTVR